MTDETVRVTIDLPIDLEKKISEIANNEMRSRHSQIVYLLSEKLNGNGNGKKEKTK